MPYLRKGLQGKIGEVKYRGKLVREIHVYINSSDFPDCEMIIMPQTDNQHQTERVPITEEIWQKVGECLGYKFKRYPNKQLKSPYRVRIRENNLESLRSRFESLKNNNKDMDWNNPVFRDTVVSALRYCAESYMEEKDAKRDKKGATVS